MRLRHLAPCLLLLSLLGCVTDAPAPGGAAGTEVIERSKPEPPQWTAQPPNVAVAGPAGWRVLTVRSKLLNLPLGLKQSQLAAVDATPAALGVEVRAQLVAGAAPAPPLAPADLAELDRMVRLAAEQAGAADVRVADIYFEQLANRALPPGDPMAKYYSAYVLTMLPAEALPRSFEALARLLQASRSAGLRSLAGSAKALAGSAKHK